MATVVITFFLITQFYVFKMDDDSTEGSRNISQREKRWSMNSQRLEEIVAELMKPISDVRRSFDTDLSALLEEYLTEAGLHALDAEEEGVSSVIPNFAELALLVQQSASIYSKKVDFLYQHVLNVSDSLHHSMQEISGAAEAEAGVEGAAGEGAAAEAQAPRRKRRSSAASGAAGEGFEAPALTAGGASRREACARPPPTLPRTFVELEPRAMADCDAPLLDFAGEPIGLLPDFHVAWRLQEGYLVEELRSATSGSARLRPVPLTELSAAIAAAAPPDDGFLSPPPPCATPPPPPCATPPPPDESPSPPPPDATSTPLPPDKTERKRRREMKPEDMFGEEVSIRINEKVRRKLQTAQVQEFSVPQTWLRRVVSARRDLVLAARQQLRLQTEPAAFRGFDESPLDVGGFAGWGSGAGTVQRPLAARRADDSDDDGFFEQSSLGDSDGSRVDDVATAVPGRPEWSAWRERVVARAARGEARGRDVQRAAAAVLRAAEQLPPAPPPAFAALLAAARRQHPAHTPELFLATLFLANAGNVEIVQGAPLSVDSFAVRLLSSDPRRYRAQLQLAEPAAPAAPAAP